MQVKFLLILPLLTAIGGTVAAQSGGDYKAPRTEYGQPDLQGVWNFSSNTPMQRPKRYGEQEFLTEEQITEAIARQEKNAAAADARAARLVINPEAPDATSDPGGYNDFWIENRGIGDTVRTSHIVYPVNGRVPAPVEGAPRQFGGLGPDIPSTRPVRFIVGGIAKDGPEDRGLSERCLVGFNAGPPFVPSLYNNNMQIFQSKNTAVILTEMVHDARIVPLGEIPELNEDVRLWSGDSRGWYEADTLVVETINLNPQQAPRNAAPLTAQGKVIERFTRYSDEQIFYEFEVTDPAYYREPWRGEISFNATDTKPYEYACHEGNYGMIGILAGARRLEQLEQ